MLIFHRLALEAELAGRTARADFFWRQSRRLHLALANQPEVWKPFLDSQAPAPEQIASAVTIELFIDTHLAFARGYLETESAPVAGNRAFAHLDHARALIDSAAVRDPARLQILLDLSLLQVAALGEKRGGHSGFSTVPPPNGFSRRMAGEASHSSATVPSFSLPSRPGFSRERYDTNALVGDLLRRYPGETRVQNCAVEAILAEAFSQQRTGTTQKDYLANAATLAGSLYRLKKLRGDFPHNISIFEAIAELHLLRARILAAAGQLAEALGDVQASLVYQPGPDWSKAQEAEQYRAELETEMQRLRVQASTPESELDPPSRRQLERIRTQAAKGFRLMDSFKHSDEARSAEEDLPVARGRQIWETIGLPPLEREDYRPLALLDALDAIQHSLPASAAELAAAWERVSCDNPHLASLDRERVQTWLRSLYERKRGDTPGFALHRPPTDAAGVWLARPAIAPLQPPLFRCPPDPVFQKSDDNENRQRTHWEPGASATYFGLSSPPLASHVFPATAHASDVQWLHPPLHAYDPMPGREPFWYWLFSPQDGLLKSACLIALVLAVCSVAFVTREYRNRAERAIAWSDMTKARDAQNFPRMLDSAERFLSHPVIGADNRTTEIRELYDEALVRWFNESRPSPGIRNRRLELYRRLSGIQSKGDRP
jgi:hypothetical protein